MEPDDGIERCVRCGRLGHDRRTLWMACFYQMDEPRQDYYMVPPFETQVLFHADVDGLRPARAAATIDVGDRSIVLGAGSVTTDGELTPRHFYTLRVCKHCRGDWLAAIQHWFESGYRLAEAVRDDPHGD